MSRKLRADVGELFLFDDGNIVYYLTTTCNNNRYFFDLVLGAHFFDLLIYYLDAKC